MKRNGLCERAALERARAIISYRDGPLINCATVMQRHRPLEHGRSVVGKSRDVRAIRRGRNNGVYDYAKSKERAARDDDDEVRHKPMVF